MGRIKRFAATPSFRLDDKCAVPFVLKPPLLSRVKGIAW